MAELALPTARDPRSFHNYLKKRHGKAFLQELDELLDEDDDPESVARRYELIFSSLDTARSFQLAASNPGFEDCLVWWDAQPHPEGDLLDARENSRQALTLLTSSSSLAV